MSIFISIIVTLYTLPKVIDLLIENNITIRNYRGRDVVTGAGIVFTFSCLLYILPLLCFKFSKDYYGFIIAVLSLSFLGFIDDLLGDRSIKGLKGHMKALLKGKLSTGSIKAIIGFITGIIISRLYYNGLWSVLINTLIFSLFINFFNLLDLRPGRAVKAFILIVTFLIIIKGINNLWILMPILSAIPLYIGGEMEEKYMLGDTGSSIIGGLVGLYSVTTLYVNEKYAVLVSLVIIHIFAEFYSISYWINKIPALRFIDNIGRVKGD